MIIVLRPISILLKLTTTRFDLIYRLQTNYLEWFVDFTHSDTLTLFHDNFDSLLISFVDPLDKRLN